VNTRHAYLNGVFDYPQLVPAGIDITHVSRVIDIGAGTGAWALDFLSLPCIYDRDIQVFVCDITTNNFPRGNEPEVRKIKFFEQDVTKPFPNELLGTFDLINFGLMSFVLRAQEWKAALRNVYSLLSERRFTKWGLLVCPYSHDTNAQSPVDASSYGKAILSRTMMEILRRPRVKSPILLCACKAHQT